MDATTNATTLNLLTRNGTVTISFTPPLEAEHYQLLHDAIYQDGQTSRELDETVRDVAQRIGRTVNISR